jgi:RNA polymerase sigma factor (TIGR02999 family)
MAEDDLLKEVYDELRSLAKQMIAKENPGHTLQATALVHEAYLKLQASYPEVLSGKNRREFFACAAEAMRRILIDQARARKARKRGGDRHKVPMEAAEIAMPQNDVDPEELSLALVELSKHDPEAEELIKLCYFVGLSHEQAAEVLEVSLSTVNRRWRYAKAWLKDFMDSRTNSDTT